MRKPVVIYLFTVYKITNPIEIPINDLWVSDLSFYKVKNVLLERLESIGKSLRFAGT